MTVDGHGADVLVIGGGPAGMSAARAAADAGLRTVLVDERPTLGGQIFKQPGPGFRVSEPRQLGAQWRYGRALIDSVLINPASAAPIDIRSATSVVSLEPDDSGLWSAYLFEQGFPVSELRVPRIIVAPGAYDRPVVFPGWTLPGVMTAGGLQTLAKTQRLLPTGRMVFAGSGPVALAFPAQLAGLDADIVTVLEAGPAPRLPDLAGIAAVALGNLDLLRDAARYRAQLLRRRVPLRYGRIIVRAEGDRRVERVVHAAVGADWQVQSGTEETIDAQLLCLGYGFAPSTELLRLAGCAVRHDHASLGQVVERDSFGRTTVRGVYAAGDGTGVEGMYVAVDEGRSAGIGAALDAGRLSPAEARAAATGPARRIRRRRALAAATSRMYRVGEGIFSLADERTIVCRCEEVTASSVSAAVETSADINVVKALTRAGMGPCQGRNCQRHIAAMISRRHGTGADEVAGATPRAPVRPVPMGAVADHTVLDPGLFLPPGEPVG